MNSMCGNHFGKKQKNQFQQKKQPALFLKIPRKKLQRQCIILKTISPKDLLEQNVSLSLSGIVHAFINNTFKWNPPPKKNQIKDGMISESVALKQAVESLRCSIKSSWVGCKPESMSAAKEFENIYICVCVDMCFICWTCSSTCHISLMAKTWLWKSDRATCRMPWIVTWTHWKNVNVLEGLMSGGGSEQLFNTWFKSISHCVMRVTGCQSSSWFT